MGFWNFISKLFAKKEITFQNSSDASLHALLTQAADEYRTEHRKKAETLFLQALEEATPSSAEPLVEYNLQFLQFLWLQNEAHPKAIKCLSDFIAKFKDSASAYRCRASLVGRGQVLVELGKLGEAQEDLGRALQLLNKVPSVRDKIWASSQDLYPERNGWRLGGDGRLF
jgi:tetratricopeptide (TPR) repeat protein